MSISRIRTLFLAGVSFAAGATGFGCAATTDSDEQEIAVAESALSTPRFPYGQDDRGYTGDGDWSWWNWKGECAQNEYLIGASRVLNANPTPGALHGILCQQASRAMTPESRTLDISDHDDRIYNDNNWDWHVGYYKAECAANEMVSGISQSSDYSGVIHHVRCINANGAVNYTKDCRRVNILDGYIPPNIWDPDNAQNNCRSGEVVRGISKSTSSSGGAIRALLCCSAQSSV